MKQCHVCQKPVSDFALECPHCKAKMDVKVQRVESISETVPPKSSQTAKPDYLSIVLLSLILFFNNQVISYFENVSVARYYGDDTMAVNIVIGNCLHPIALTIFTVLLVCVAMRMYHHKQESLRVYSIISLAVIVIFGLFAILLAQIITPQLFLNDAMLIEMAKKWLPSKIIFASLLYPGFVLLSYWGIHTLGKKKGYIATTVGALLLLIIMVLRGPLCVGMKLGWTAMYSGGFPIFTYLLFVGILVVMKITTGKK